AHREGAVLHWEDSTGGGEEVREWRVESGGVNNAVPSTLHSSTPSLAAMHWSSLAPPAGSRGSRLSEYLQRRHRGGLEQRPGNLHRCLFADVHEIRARRIPLGE